MTSLLHDSGISCTRPPENYSLSPFPTLSMLFSGAAFHDDHNSLLTGAGSGNNNRLHRRVSHSKRLLVTSSSTPLHVGGGPTCNGNALHRAASLSPSRMPESSQRGHPNSLSQQQQQQLAPPPPTVINPEGRGRKLPPTPIRKGFCRAISSTFHLNQLKKGLIHL